MKIWTIAWRQLYATFSQRNLLLIMVAAPLVLSTIMGLAFSGFAGDDFGLEPIPVALVNLDEGTGIGPITLFSAGSLLVDILLPPKTDEFADEAEGAADEGFTLPECSLTQSDETGEDETSIQDILRVTELRSVKEARDGVQNGLYAAAVIVRPDFSQAVMPSLELFASDDAQTSKPSESWGPQLEIHGDEGQPLGASVARSVVESIAGQLAQASVGVAVFLDALNEEVDLESLGSSGPDFQNAPDEGAPLSEWQEFLLPAGNAAPWLLAIGGADDSVLEAASCILDPDVASVRLEHQPLDELQEQNAFTQMMAFIGSAQAAFFALFTGLFGALSIYDERKQGTLQRMLVSPISSNVVMAGKLLGNLITVLAQLAVLLLALTLVVSILGREPVFIWGDDYGLLLLLLLALSLSVSGLGVLVTGISRTREQAQIAGPIVNTMMGALGGTFGFFMPAVFARFSLIYWATDAFSRLAGGDSDVWLNVLVLTLMGVVFFGVGSVWFKKRMEG